MVILNVFLGSETQQSIKKKKKKSSSCHSSVLIIMFCGILGVCYVVLCYDVLFSASVVPSCVGCVHFPPLSAALPYH